MPDLELFENDEPIEIVPYHPAWPSRFESERAALAAAIRDWVAGGIHHVGSTAVPGLDAKPTIDILIGVEDLESSRPCFGRLATLGYLYAPYRAEEMHWFCKPSFSLRTHHLHLVPFRSPLWDERLRFRDCLRSTAAVAEEYAALKYHLAEIHRFDREAYTEAKGAFIARVLHTLTDGGTAT